MRKSLLLVLLLIITLWFITSFLLFSLDFKGRSSPVLSSIKFYLLAFSVISFLVSAFIILVLFLQRPAEKKPEESASFSLLEVLSRKEAETEKILEQIMESFSFPTLLLDEGRVIYFNRLFKEVFPEVEKGKQLGFFLKSQSPHYQWIGGRYYRVESSGVAISKERKVSFVMLKDVTEERQDLEAATEKERLAALGEIAGFLSHEIKNSLSVLLAYLKVHRTPQMKEVEEELRKVERLVNEFIDYARPFKPSLSEVNLKKEIEKILAGGNLSVKVEGEGVALADPILLEQILSNLLRNSLEAGAKEVRVSIKGHGKYLRVDLEDDGEGIPAENLDKIFIPFFTTKEKGSGMGLAFVKKSLLAMGGNIVAEPSSKGAHFVLYLKRP